MSNGLNNNELNKYVAEFSMLVLNQAYRSQQILTGQDLLKISPVKQVNLGILNRLFETWKGNAESFRSSFFDFQNESVKNALVSFMNTVSQHIAVKRNDLEPLLEDSTFESLELLLSPEKYFTDKINNSGKNGFNYEMAEQLYKYTNIHKKVAEKLAQDLAASGQTSVSASEAIGWLSDALLLKDSTVVEQEYFNQFDQILTLEKERMFLTGMKSIKEETIKTDDSSFFDTAFGDSDRVLPKANATIKAEPGLAVLSEIVAKSTQPEQQSLNNSFKVDIPKPKEDKTYGTMPVKVETIADAIPLGQRFMFVNQLFSRNNEHFEKAIYELDAVKSYEEAEDLIWHRYASKYAWDVNGEAVTTLLSIVKRKFN